MTTTKSENKKLLHSKKIMSTNIYLYKKQCNDECIHYTIVSEKNKTNVEPTKKKRKTLEGLR